MPTASAMSSTAVSKYVSRTKLRMKVHERIQLGVLALLTLSVLFIWYAVTSVSDGKARISFLDVGQGDAIFIEGPNGAQVLIDGGAGLSVIRELGRAMPFFDRSIDVVIATHPDRDHIGGLVDVFERYRVSSFIYSGNERDTAVFDELNERVEEEGGVTRIARAGHVIHLGDGAYLRIFYPDQDVTHVESNAASIVSQFVYGDTEILLTGDAPAEIEGYLTLLYGEALASDVLKLGHHGSNTSNGRPLLSLVSPEYAVASAGCGNSYGHPHDEVVTDVTDLGIELFSTCEDGTITFIADGEFLTVK